MRGTVLGRIVRPVSPVSLSSYDYYDYYDYDYYDYDYYDYDYYDYVSRLRKNRTSCRIYVKLPTRFFMHT